MTIDDGVPDMNLVALPHGLAPRGVTLRAVVETPRGSTCKFTYSPDLEAFELSKRLPLGLAFPLDFGFVPGTRAEDGDPLDILILADAVLPVGCVLQVRLLGVLEADQTAEGRTYRNDRLIGAAVESAALSRLARLSDLGAAWLDQLTTFWVTYNEARGRRFEPLARREAAAAAELVRRQTVA